MSVSILVVDDEPDVADLFRQQFRREAHRGTYVMYFAAAGAEAMDRLAVRYPAPIRQQHPTTSAARIATKCRSAESDRSSR